MVSGNRSLKSSSQSIGIIDYGVGNLASVRNALAFLGCQVSVVTIPEQIQQVDGLILPGVGSFHHCISRLTEMGLIEPLVELIKRNNKKFLGICAGMQVLFDRGLEGGSTRGLQVFKGDVTKFQFDDKYSYRVPHMGFDSVVPPSQSMLFKGVMGSKIDFYFCHSYRVLHQDQHNNEMVGTCEYPDSFVAYIERDNCFGCQFHLEKSQMNGLRLLQNFLDL